MKIFLAPRSNETPYKNFSSTIVQHVGDAPERYTKILYNKFYPAIGEKAT